MQRYRKQLAGFMKPRVKKFPSFLHLILFLTLVCFSVLSLNFEVLRVIRLGDLLLMLVAFFVGVHWYGQKMLDEGFQNGVKRATTRKDSLN